MDRTRRPGIRLAAACLAAALGFALAFADEDPLSREFGAPYARAMKLVVVPVSSIRLSPSRITSLCVSPAAHFARLSGSDAYA